MNTGAQPPPPAVQSAGSDVSHPGTSPPPQSSPGAPCRDPFPPPTPPLGNMTPEMGMTGTVEGACCLPSADLPSQGPEPPLRGQQPGRSHRDLDGLALSLGLPASDTRSSVPLETAAEVTALRVQSCPVPEGG